MAVRNFREIQNKFLACNQFNRGKRDSTGARANVAVACIPEGGISIKVCLCIDSNTRNRAASGERSSGQKAVVHITGWNCKRGTRHTINTGSSTCRSSSTHTRSSCANTGPILPVNPIASGTIGNVFYHVAELIGKRCRISTTATSFKNHTIGIGNFGIPAKQKRTEGTRISALIRFDIACRTSTNGNRHNQRGVWFWCERVLPYSSVFRACPFCVRNSRVWRGRYGAWDNRVYGASFKVNQVKIAVQFHLENAQPIYGTSSPAQTRVYIRYIKRPNLCSNLIIRKRNHVCVFKAEAGR
ncbi:hypothetical protein D3C80_619890 [compost metagenome]